MRYASETTAHRLDILDIVTKNERAYKQAAEKLMSQNSQLQNEDLSKESPSQSQRRLMMQKQLTAIKIENKTCVAAVE